MNLEQMLGSLLSDRSAFILAEGTLVFFAIRALYVEKHRGNPEVRIIRGPEGWACLPIGFAVLSTIWIQLIAVVSVNEINGYRGFLTLVNIFLLAYLCFLNGWFRNKIVGFITHSQSLVEKN
jgi:hypothetical protein